MAAEKSKFFLRFGLHVPYDFTIRCNFDQKYR